MDLERHGGKSAVANRNKYWPGFSFLAVPQGSGRIPEKHGSVKHLRQPTKWALFPKLKLKQPQALEPASVDDDSGIPRPPLWSDSRKAPPSHHPWHGVRPTLEIKSEESPQWLRLRFPPGRHDKGSKSKINWLSYIKKCDVSGKPNIGTEFIFTIRLYHNICNLSFFLNLH